jgi:MtfA peptidase
MPRGFFKSIVVRLRTVRQNRTLHRRAIDERLWQSTLTALPFVQALPATDLARLRRLASLFLDRKEFSGARGWVITDAQAVMVATQACLPLLHIAPPDRPDLAVRWYDGFVGIVLHAGEVRARRTAQDAAGVVHHWQEDLSGEAMHGGPLMLAYSDVAAAGNAAGESYNVVIHEFIHVIDMQDGLANGCPPMPSDASRVWLSTLQAAFEAFGEHAARWERFGSLAGSPPLLDSYGASNLAEFFAVAGEAYFVRRADFAAAHPALLTLFDGFFMRYRPSDTQTKHY